MNEKMNVSRHRDKGLLLILRESATMSLELGFSVADIMDIFTNVSMIY